MEFSIRFWGVRGSVPAPGPRTAAVGGNTSCVEIRAGDEILILDGGTGLRHLGEDLLARRGERGVRASILFSHVHWDHIQGVPFFAPIFRPDTALTFYGSPEVGTIEETLARQMTGPAFPVRLGDLPSSLSFREVASGSPLSIGPMRVVAETLNHPNGVYAYRIEAGGHAVVYATDTEHYPDRIDVDLVELARGADVLIYDAMYTPEEYPARVGWGHSTWTEGVEVARAAGVGSLVLFHHDPKSDDLQIAAIERAAAAARPGTVAAREGMVISLAGGHSRLGAAA